jgi:long-chain fatty acid transport protein
MTKKNLIGLALTLTVLPALASANGLSLNGLGTRAQGMGGAFVSIADDFSAVFWNPAGAAGFKQTTFGFSASDLMPRMTYRETPEAASEPLVAAKTKISHYLSFLAGYYKPVSDRLVLGIGIGTPSAQGVMWNGADFAGLSDGVSYDWSSRVYRFSFSPMAAVKISDAISFGAALNIDYGNFSLKRWGGLASLADPFETVDLGQYEEAMNGWGVGATFGVLIKPGERLSLGLTVRTPSTISFNGSASLSNLILYGPPSSSDLKRKITWPLSVAGGVSFRPTNRLLLSADVEWKQWSKLERISTTFAESAWAPISLNARPVWPLDWKDAIQVRFGGEYALSPATAVRAGYYRDPAPGPNMDILLPTFTSDVFTIGLGKTLGGLQLDFGLEYMAGHKRELGTPLFTTYVMTMHAVVPSVSASYKF